MSEETSGQTQPVGCPSACCDEDPTLVGCLGYGSHLRRGITAMLGNWETAPKTYYFLFPCVDSPLSFTLELKDSTLTFTLGGDCKGLHS